MMLAMSFTSSVRITAVPDRSENQQHDLINAIHTTVVHRPVTDARVPHEDDCAAVLEGETQHAQVLERHGPHDGDVDAWTPCHPGG